ncbi:hypothetical protein AYI69_g9466 [Smittium culicis]|uniref:Ferric reductase NAD binding domain-containing protein n=1 Tax=Smittium culicis TaxID=133412 RepID=A0A1R1XCD0_9FUNG|nr:hypothetical protein AYI69_g9466 [Smittium culicis]
MVELVIDLDTIKRYSPAKLDFGIVYINIPSLSLVEWHPFDVCFEEGESSVSLFIAKGGKWTGKLFDKVGEGVSRINTITTRNSLEEINVVTRDEGFLNDTHTVKMYSTREGNSTGTNTINEKGSPQSFEPLLDNPGFAKFPLTVFISNVYDSKLRYIFENDVAILIAGGSAISHMISVIKHFMKSQTNNSLNTKKIYLFWTCLEQDTLALLKDVELRVISSGLTEKIVIRKYYKTPSEFGYNDFDQIQTNHLAQEKSAISSIFPSIQERIDVISSIDQCIDEKSLRYGVLAIGNTKLVKSSRRASNFIRRKYKLGGKLQFYV